METLIQKFRIQATEIEEIFKSKLEIICKADKPFELKQREIESLIYNFLKEITEDELDAFVMWDKSEAQIYFEGFSKTYDFGEYGTFFACNCFSGYEIMFSDIMDMLISKSF